MRVHRYGDFEEFAHALKVRGGRQQSEKKPLLSHPERKACISALAVTFLSRFRNLKSEVPPLPLKRKGGQGGSRTHGTDEGTLDFESSALNHSATCPMSNYQQLAMFLKNAS